MMQKEIKRIAVEYSDGTKEIIWRKEEPQAPTTKNRNLELAGLTAYVVRIDPVKPSYKGGEYQRHYFRNIEASNDLYILDINKWSTGVFKHLQLGDTLTNLSSFARNGKLYINGKCRPNFIGVWKDLEAQLSPKKSPLTGFENIFENL